MNQKFELRQFLGLAAMCFLIYAWYQPWIYLNGGLYQSGEHIGGKAYLFLVAAAVYGIAVIIRQYEVACFSAFGAGAVSVGMFVYYEPNALGLAWMAMAAFFMFQVAANPISKAIDALEKPTPWQTNFYLIQAAVGIAAVVFFIYVGYRLFSSSGDENVANTADKPPVTRPAQQNHSIDDARAAVLRGDHGSAVKAFEVLASNGNVEAQVELGLMYENGNGVQQSYSQAEKWYRQAAARGYHWGQNNLGVLYQNGWAVPKNTATAAAWYQKAADQGNSDAQANLCYLYMGQEGVPANYKEAFRLCKLSADQGNPSGQNNLGVLYEHGWGVKRSKDEAFKQYVAATAQGHQLAKENLEKLTGMKR